MSSAKYVYVPSSANGDRAKAYPIHISVVYFTTFTCCAFSFSSFISASCVTADAGRQPTLEDVCLDIKPQTAVYTLFSKFPWAQYRPPATRGDRGLESWSQFVQWNYIVSRSPFSRRPMALLLKQFWTGSGVWRAGWLLWTITWGPPNRRLTNTHDWKRYLPANYADGNEIPIKYIEIVLF